MSEPASLRRPAKKVEFLERETYRQRRFRDAARMLPVFAAVLMFLPLMWPRDDAGQSLTSSGMIYLFGLWVVLVAVSFALSRVLKFEGEVDPTLKQEAAKTASDPAGPLS